MHDPTHALYNILHADGRIEPVEGLTWMRWRGTDPAITRIGETTVGDARISTIFIGLDALGHGLLFETMVFGGAFDMTQQRYRTLDEARAGHAALVARQRAWPTRGTEP